MSTPLIVALVIGVIIAVLLLMYFHQLRQSSKDNQKRQLNSLASRANNLSTLAQSIPAKYIDKNIQLLLLQTATERLHQLKSADPKHDYQSQIEDLALLIDNVKSGRFVAATHTPGDEAQGKELRNNLKSLFKFIEIQSNNGKINRKLASQQLLKTQYFLCESLADAHVARANQAEKYEKYRVAIHHLHDAIEALKKVAGNALAQEAMANHRQRMTLLDARARKQSQAKSEVVTAASSQVLSEQLNDLEEEELEWKRKQDYEK